MQRLLLPDSWQLQALRCVCCLHVLCKRQRRVCWAGQTCLLQLCICLVAGYITSSCIVQQYLLYIMQQVFQFLHQACLL
jgi:hypothetical protein